ncbi:MAG TPA: arginase family protein [Thermodesulfobacteriota bacterium]
MRARRDDPRSSLDPRPAADRLGAGHAGRVEPPACDPRRDPETRMLNPRAIAAYSVALGDAVGGDCSILLGNLLALRRRGRYGLLFLDGHTDFYQPEAEPNGEAASMDLALATGRGPAVVTDLEGRRPLLRDDDAAAFGFRDADEAAEHGSQPLPRELRGVSLAEVRRLGIEPAVRGAVAHLTRGGGAGGFWIHLDADVLDDAVMPAVDYRIPGGLGWGELEGVLRAAIGSGRAVGLDVTVFNPNLDLDGSIARALAETLGRGLTA